MCEEALHNLEINNEFLWNVETDCHIMTNCTVWCNYESKMMAITGNERDRNKTAWTRDAVKCLKSHDREACRCMDRRATGRRERWQKGQGKERDEGRRCLNFRGLTGSVVEDNNHCWQTAGGLRFLTSIYGAHLMKNTSIFSTAHPKKYG